MLIWGCRGRPSGLARRRLLDWAVGERAGPMYPTQCFLVFVLIAAQLLAGGGGSFHLCISDGLFCCIREGSVPCTCCREPDCLPPVKCCENSECGLHLATQAETDGVDDQCSCVHIPVVIPPLEPATLADGTSVPVVDQVITIQAWQSCLAPATRVVWPSVVSNCSGPPGAPAYTLNMLSTIVIRC